MPTVMMGLQPQLVRINIFGLEAEYYPATHGTLFDCAQVKDRKVFFLDFCFPIDIMKEIKILAKKLTILDHHKTAEEALKELTFEGV